MTNEQRAHDIAVALLQSLIEEGKRKAQAIASESQEQLGLHIDSVKIYMDTYAAVLKALDKKFTD